MVFLGYNISQIAGESCPEQLHLKELHQIVDGVDLVFFSSGS
jgi:hypothetical protein